MLARFRIPSPAAAAVVVALLVGAVGGGMYSLAGPAQTLAASAPETLAKAIGSSNTDSRARPKRRDSVERAAGTLGGTAAVDRTARPIVVSTAPTIGSRILGTTQVLVAGILEVAILLYFLLAGGDLFLQKLVKVLPYSGDKRKAVEIARATEAAVSAFLSTALLVNLAEGIVVAGLFWLLKMPSPVLWGVMVAAFEFVPYLGALTGVVVLGVAGLTTFDSVGHALLIPEVFSRST